MKIKKILILSCAVVLVEMQRFFDFLMNLEVYSEPCQKSDVKRFAILKIGELKKKVILKITQNLQENICVRASFLIT